MPEIIFIRNAQGDGESLTPEGEAQSRRAGEVLNGLGFIPDLVITSNNPRCQRTGQLMAERLEMQPRFAVLPKLENLMDADTYYLHIAPIFEELGFERPISEYLVRDTAGILLSHAEVVVEEINLQLRDAQQVLIVGHHLVQNLVGVALAGEDPILLGPEFEHLTGYWIHEDKSVSDVSLTE